MQPDLNMIIWLVVLPLLILSIEALNTGIEYTCDKITMDRSNKIKKAKDLGSAAIFLALVAYSAVVLLDISKLFLSWYSLLERYFNKLIPASWELKKASMYVTKNS